MPKLTAKQTNELASHFLAFAQAIGDYRYEHFKSLSKRQNQRLKDFHWTILQHADELFTRSAVLVMDEVQTSLTTIAEISSQMKDTYKTLQQVQKALNVAASVVTLGTSILSNNPQAMADSLGNLLHTWKE